MKLIHAAVVGLFLVAVAGTVYAQLSENVTDPCAVYPHSFANIPNATPTAKLVAGILNKQIYVCSVHVAMAAGATPGLTLSYGEVVAATPCATSTPGGTIGVYGGAPAGSTINVGTGNYSIAVVPAAASTPVVDLCGLTASANFVGGSIEYVQR